MNQSALVGIDPGFSRLGGEMVSHYTTDILNMKSSIPHPSIVHFPIKGLSDTGIDPTVFQLKLLRVKE